MRAYSRLAVTILTLVAAMSARAFIRSAWAVAAARRGIVVLLAGEDLAGLHDVAFLDQHLAHDAGGAGGDLDHPALDVGLAVGDGREGVWAVALAAAAAAVAFLALAWLDMTEKPTPPSSTTRTMAIQKAGRRRKRGHSIRLR
jgi:hypothetical protein